MARCPRCGKQTELRLALPPEGPGVPRKGIVLTVVAVLILIAGLVASLVALKRFERLVARQKERAALAAATEGATIPAGLEVTAISLQKGQSGGESYAVGTLLNTSGRKHSRITVEFDVLDAKGQKVEVARAYRPALEPGAKWEIKVPVAADSKAVSVKLASVKEGPD